MKVRSLVLVSLFAALTALGGFISIPLGPVPITMQSIFVILSGLLLGPRLGALSQLLYVFLGLVGLPIFSGFSGGLQAILRPSFGFLIGFIFSSYLGGTIYQSRKSPYRIYLATILASLTSYIFGLAYMYLMLNLLASNPLTLGYIIRFGFLVFLPGDLIKLFLIIIIAKRILPLFK